MPTGEGCVTALKSSRLTAALFKLQTDLQNVMATLPNGWRVKLSYRSEGKTVETLVRMMGVHLEDELLKKMAGALPPPPPRPQKPSQDDPDAEPQDPDAEQGDKPNKNENRPRQRGQGPAKPAVKTPQQVKDQLVERKGFANYHFNLAEQNSFIDALRNQFPATNTAIKPPSADEQQAWLITGETDQTPAQPVTIQGRSRQNVFANWAKNTRNRQA